MPIALDPTATLRVVLRSDQNDPPTGTEPAFIVRYLTCREWRKINDAQHKLATSTDGNTALDTIIEAIGNALVGWEGMTGPDGKDIPFDLPRLYDMLTIQEAMELLQGVLNQSVPEEKDLKKSESP